MQKPRFVRGFHSLENRENNVRALLFPDRFAFLVHVFNAGLVDQQIRRAGPIHLQAVLVVPLDDAVDLFIVLQYQHHGSLGLHLFLVIKIFGVSLLWRRSLFSVRCTVWAFAALAAVAVVGPVVFAAIQRRANQPAIGKHLAVKTATQIGSVHGIFHGVCSYDSHTSPAYSSTSRGGRITDWRDSGCVVPRTSSGVDLAIP